MNRRDFITLFGGAAAAWPLAARGQQAGKMWRIGLIEHEPMKHYDVLFDELRQLGYVEGHNIIVERRYAQGSAERFDEFAAEMVRVKADLIIVDTTPAAIAVKKVGRPTSAGICRRQEPDH
jgi:putative ABC transport system substrate-binding protein